ncbi:hypothetical protein F2Q70_00008866 [Brassica cretica]|uniref:Uncharacterized protein n=1 Tax=Brassica cretica TaxID=69181 RepID=A0A8S9MCF9_BRACR|nr:hypothetical protein F2Q70_00008866 [Brassica cretica]
MSVPVRAMTFAKFTMTSSLYTLFGSSCGVDFVLSLSHPGGNVSNGCLPLVSSSECDTGEDDSAEQVEQVPVEQLQFPVPVVQEAMVLRTQKVEAQAMLVPDQC